MEQVKEEGKPEHIQDRIVEGKLGKFYKENALLEQPFVKDPDRSVGELVAEVAGTAGVGVT
ncbi:MAG: elongation factor Ts, partial [Gemmatimonadetes bacterium]|nr:elongation factor Ts [Gemmatimonadota bacterium]NIX43850.1 elongation factor Ts [Gemmatimonadota bacterium]